MKEIDRTGAAYCHWAGAKVRFPRLARLLLLTCGLSIPIDCLSKLSDLRSFDADHLAATTLTASFLIETLDAQGNATQITRRADRRITAIGTAQRNYTLSYGANGFVQEIRDPANRTMSLTYTPANRIETLTDAAGGVTRYTYVGDTEFPAEPLCPQGTDGERIKTIHYPGRPNPSENFHGPARRVLRQLAYDGIETRFAYRVAYFSPSWTAFQADRGRDFSVIVDGVSG